MTALDLGLSPLPPTRRRWPRRVALGVVALLVVCATTAVAFQQYAEASCGRGSEQVNAEVGRDWLTSEGYTAQGRIFTVRHPRSWHAQFLPNGSLALVDEARGNARLMVVGTNETKPTMEAVRKLAVDGFRAAADVADPPPPKTAVLGNRRGCFLHAFDATGRIDLEGVFLPIDDHVLLTVAYLPRVAPPAARRQARAIISSFELTEESG